MGIRKSEFVSKTQFRFIREMKKKTQNLQNTNFYLLKLQLVMKKNT